MNKTKQFVKDHHKTIIAIGGTVLVTIVARALVKKELLKAFNKAIDVVEDLPELPSYDMWMMTGPNCKQEMFDEITKIVSEYGKTINIELFD